ncbi:uncharacterized protein LOC143299106 [Babylonia areolata]|uniref:uncharacterized protein LOC143299106 n=1 Tax=Babylonia areolata TaxID=304850 RepID=UPI003FD1DF21
MNTALFVNLSDRIPHTTKTMTTASKQVFYSPPQRLLTKRKKGEGGRPTLTVTIPFSFSTRLSRCDRRLQSASSSIRRTSATSLPRLAPRSARPSAHTSSTDDNSGSVVRKAGSLCDTNASASGPADPRGGVEVGGASESAGPEEQQQQQQQEGEEVLSPEEEKERRLSHKKCLRWLEGLPDKFSGMHVVQPMVHTDSR